MGLAISATNLRVDGVGEQHIILLTVFCAPIRSVHTAHPYTDMFCRDQDIDMTLELCPGIWWSYSPSVTHPGTIDVG